MEEALRGGGEEGEGGKMTYRCDRLAYARSVLGDEVWWTYDTVEDPDRDTRRWFARSPHNDRNKPSNKLSATLRGSERYMDDLFNQELEHQVKEDIYRDEWEEHCVDKTHRDGCCPNSADLKERKDYEDTLAKRLADDSAREEWYRTRMNDDWQWLAEHLDEDCQQVEFIEWFLEKHPIDGALRYYNSEEYGKVDLADIVGYCPECNQPAKADEIRPMAAPYETAEDGKAITEPTLVCACCNAETPLNDEEFIKGHNRPFNWPPDAPYPPRRHFDGTPLDVPFYEE